MISSGEVWQWANLALPLFGGLAALILGVGVAMWILGFIADLVKRK